MHQEFILSNSYYLKMSIDWLPVRCYPVLYFELCRYKFLSFYK